MASGPVAGAMAHPRLPGRAAPAGTWLFQVGMQCGHHLSSRSLATLSRSLGVEGVRGCALRTSFIRPFINRGSPRHLLRSPRIRCPRRRRPGLPGGAHPRAGSFFLPMMVWATFPLAVIYWVYFDVLMQDR